MSTPNFTSEEIDRLRELLEKPADILIAELFETFGKLIREGYAITQECNITPITLNRLINKLQADATVIEFAYSAIHLYMEQEGWSMDDLLIKIATEQLDKEMAAFLSAFKEK